MAVLQVRAVIQEFGGVEKGRPTGRYDRNTSATGSQVNSASRAPAISSVTASATGVRSSPVHMTRLNPVPRNTSRGPSKSGCSHAVPPAAVTLIQTPSPSARSSSVFRNGGAAGWKLRKLCVALSKVKRASNCPAIVAVAVPTGVAPPQPTRLPPGRSGRLWAAVGGGGGEILPHRQPPSRNRSRLRRLEKPR